MIPEEPSRGSLFSALENANLVYFDGRLPEIALIVAEEASQSKIPVLINYERKREGLDELLNFASYVVCSENFPKAVTQSSPATIADLQNINQYLTKQDLTGAVSELPALYCQMGTFTDPRLSLKDVFSVYTNTSLKAWTSAPSLASALVSILIRLPHLKFVITTRGDEGSLMLERSRNDASELAEQDADILLESLQGRVDDSVIPTCISSKSDLRISADGIGLISGRLLVGTAEKIPPSELIGTTGAGDAFIAAVLYALCAKMPPEKMLPFASQVAAAGCRALGARNGMPWHNDPRLAPFWP